MITFGILKPLNQCKLTGLESLQGITSIDGYKKGYSVRWYSDNNNFNRFVICDEKSKVLACILFDGNGVAIFRETGKEYRLQGLQGNLWLFAAVALGGRISHSDNLTSEGKKLLKLNVA